MGEVINLDIVTSLDVDPDRVVKGLAAADLESIVAVGFDNDGNYFFASSLASTPEVLYLLRRTEHELFKREDEIAAAGVDPRGSRGT